MKIGLAMHALPACLVTIMAFEGEKRMIISAASDYRAAANAFCRRSCSTIWMGVHILNNAAPQRGRFVRSGAAPAYSENMSDLSLETTLFNEKLSMPVR